MLQIEPLLTPSELRDFLDQHQLKLIVKERWYKRPGHARRWQASLADAEVVVGTTRYHYIGVGATEEEAIYDYAGKVTGKRIVTRDGREIDVTQPKREVYAQP